MILLTVRLLKTGKSRTRIEPDYSQCSTYCPVETGYGTIEPRHEKTGFCICENKGADQLRGDREADLRLCYRYTDSTTPLLPKFKCQASSNAPFCGCTARFVSETPKTVFSRTRLIREVLETYSPRWARWQVKPQSPLYIPISFMISAQYVCFFW